MHKSGDIFIKEDNHLIIKSLKEGDEGVFDKIYRHYFPGLYAFCTRYVSQHEAEEIVQDTMMWLWENKHSLIPSLPLKTLLFTIVKNKALNRITHIEIKRRVHQEIIDKYEEEFSSPDFYLGNELFELYQKALKKIPADFLEVYQMNRYQQLTHKEIAEKLNVSPQTVNYRIIKALKILKEELKDYLPLILFILFRFYR